MAGDVDARERLERALGGPVPDSARPAVVSVAADLLGLRDELLAGFEDRRAVVEWHQRAAVAALGRQRRPYYERLARTMWPRDGRERVLLACLLADDARERDVAPSRATAFRERVAAATLLPAYHRAVRHLRKSAGEYVGESDGDRGADGDAHDPAAQRHVAMRPALSELGEWQERALARLLDGFDARRDVLDWAVPVEIATQGRLAETWTRRCYRERSTARVLVGGDAAATARAATACHHLLPAMAAAARDLADRAGEAPAAGVTPDDGPLPHGTVKP